ncbi:MAG: SCP2 sterol-binding domain-containing protein [Acidobacteriia bacterium]|nr:SCP2 sterol-binding domain-containing protein [Terriglobia bacterium]
MEILTEAWATAWRDALNTSATYREAAASWEGAVVAAVRGEPERGIASRAVFLDLWHGACRAARPATDADIETARYVLTASASTWADLLGGALDPVSAVMGGRLELTKGSVMALLPHLAAAKELVAAARSVAATAPAEWSAR